MNKEELSERIQFVMGKILEGQFDSSGKGWRSSVKDVEQLISEVIDAIVPEKKKYTVIPDSQRGISRDFIEGFARGETMGQSDAIETITKSKKELLG